MDSMLAVGETTANAIRVRIGAVSRPSQARSVHSSRAQKTGTTRRQVDCQGLRSKTRSCTSGRMPGRQGPASLHPHRKYAVEDRSDVNAPPAARGDSVESRPRDRGVIGLRPASGTQTPSVPMSSPQSSARARRHLSLAVGAEGFAELPPARWCQRPRRSCRFLSQPQRACLGAHAVVGADALLLCKLRGEAVPQRSLIADALDVARGGACRLM